VEKSKASVDVLVTLTLSPFTEEMDENPKVTLCGQQSFGANRRTDTIEYEYGMLNNDPRGFDLSFLPLICCLDGLDSYDYICVR
jgi:hypothetical protein